jgi:glycosyltransferase involved in cell wall biosynthesis
LDGVVIRSAFFSSYVGMGGGETSLLALLTRLDRHIHEPVLVCPREGRLTDRAKEAGIQVALAPYRGASTWFIPGLWAALPATRRLEDVLKRIEPNAVYSDDHSLPYALPACNRMQIPLIYRCFGWWFHPKPWQRRFFRDGPMVILAISKSVRQGFLGEPPCLPPSRVKVMYLGVDEARFRPRPREGDRLRSALQLPLEAPIVTLMARYQDVKGHDVFVDACRAIAAKLPGAHFVIAGDNAFGGRREERFAESIIQSVRSDRVLRHRVTFTGWVSNPEDLLAASDVVVSTSRLESFGMVIIEAMACGVPVVSTDAGGQRESVIDGETGYLVPNGQPAQIADRVVRLLASDPLRRRMGAAGRARVVKHFTLDRYAESFSKLLVSAAGKQGNGPAITAARGGTS